MVLCCDAMRRRSGQVNGRSHTRGFSACGTYQDNLRLVELLLDSHDGIGLTRILISVDVVGNLTKRPCRQNSLALWRLFSRPCAQLVDTLLVRCFGHLEHEFVEELVEQRKGDADGVFCVRDQDASDAVRRRARVNMSYIGVLLHRLALCWRRSLGDRLQRSIPVLAHVSPSLQRLPS